VLVLHDVLIIGGIAIGALLYTAYMWKTRVKRRAFARRVARAERIRRSAGRPGLGPWNWG